MSAAQSRCYSLVWRQLADASCSMSDPSSSSASGVSTILASLANFNVGRRCIGAVEMDGL